MKKTKRTTKKETKWQAINSKAKKWLEAKLDWAQKKKVHWWLLLLAGLLLGWAVFLGKDKLAYKVKTTIKNSRIVLENLNKEFQNLINSTLMRNTEQQNVNSIAAVVLVHSLEGLQRVKESSFFMVVSSDIEGANLIGSSFFVRKSLFFKKSNVVMSAAHVCIYGLGRKKLQETLSYVTQKTYIWDEVPYGLVLKNQKNEVFIVKSIDLNIENDLCVMSVDRDSNFSMPIHKHYIPNSLFGEEEPINIKSFAVQPNYHVWLNEGKAMSTEFFTMNMNILCEPLESLKTKNEIEACLRNSQCSKTEHQKLQDLLRNDFFYFMYWMDNLNQCIRSGVYSSPIMTPIFYQMANINIVPGNSGGAVLNSLSGLVIGVISATDRRSNVGLFVPLYGVELKCDKTCVLTVFGKKSPPPL